MSIKTMEITNMRLEVYDQWVLYKGALLGMFVKNKSHQTAAGLYQNSMSESKRELYA